MTASLLFAIRSSLAALLMFRTAQQSEAIGWSKQPTKPTILVEGINNTDQSLVWEFFLESNETVQNVLLQRKKPGEKNPTTFASRLAGSSFTLLDGTYRKEYDTSLPNTLILKNVTNDEEFIYLIVVNYIKNNVAQPRKSDQVELIVFVPPKITKEPVKQSEVDVGQNSMLSCKADGDPTPKIIWTKDGVPFEQFNSIGSDLLLTNVQRENVGSYRCTATNAYGSTTSIAVVNINCPSNHCQVQYVGITILSVEWDMAFANNRSVEQKMFKANLSSAISRLYSMPHNAEKQLFKLTVVTFRRRSSTCMAVVQLQFQKDVDEPLKPLRDDISDGYFGMFKVERQLDLNPIPTTSSRPTSSRAESKHIQRRGIVEEIILILLFQLFQLFLPEL
ncbi:uncharacterized protein [Porites lutea]|uniref:uncharacterized protein n=1 Tax=Porites lutea TaxID=51062 RepID=UPI003CC52E45